MAKLTQSAVRELADEWAALNEKIDKANLKRNAELADFVEEFTAKTQPIHDKYDARIAKLAEEKAAIETTVVDWLTAQGKPLTIEGTRAVAANETKVGSRMIDAEKFFAMVRTKGVEFWACVTIQIAKAERFLGKTEVDKISTKDTKLMPVLKAK